MWMFLLLLSLVHADTDFNLRPWSLNGNETPRIWFLHPPWKRRNDPFNDNVHNHSVEYFGLNAEDHLDNDSYIRSAPIRVCKVINITLSSRVNSAPAHVGLVLLIFHSNEWHQVWNHTHDDHQWKFHHLQLDMNRSIDHIQLRLMLQSDSLRAIDMDVGILHLSTYTNCRNSKVAVSKLPAFTLFRGVFFLILTAIVVLFTYGIVEKQCNKLARRRADHQHKARKKKNAIRDESTVLSLVTHPV